MSERYSKLFALPENLYAAGSPVVIAAGALLKDNQTGKVLAQLKIKNIGTKSIKAAKVNIQPLDTVGNPLGGEVEYQYLDLAVTRDNEFGQKSPIAIADTTTRAYRAAVTEVVFADNTIWKGAEESWDALSSPSSLSDYLTNAELVKQYRLKFGSDCKYAPTTQKDLWYCACGALNHADESVCHSCRKSASALLSADIAALKKERDERVAAEQQKAAEEKAVADAKAKKTKKLAIIITPVVVVLIVAAVLISNVVKKNQEEAARLESYNTAISMVEAGRYDEAIVVFSALGDYKDSVQQIEITKKAKEEAEIEKANAEAYAEAEAFFAEGQYGAACGAFDALGDYKDSKERLKESLYHQAVWLLEQGEDAAAYDSFLAAEDFGNAQEYIEDFLYLVVKAKGESSKNSDYYSYDSQGRVKEIVSNNSYSSTTVYNYNEDGSFSVEYFANSNWMYTEFYNSHGDKIQYVSSTAGEADPYEYEYYDNGMYKRVVAYHRGKPSWTKEYDEEGNYIVTSHLSGNVSTGKIDQHNNVLNDYFNGIPQEHHYTYNENSQLVYEDTYRNGELYDYSEYTYDEYGSLIQIYYYNTNTQMDSTTRYEYTYGYVYCPDAE